MESLTGADPVVLGRFTLLGRLGAGGMGQVYLGREPGGGLAAVKVIHPGFTSDPQFRRRFAREIATARAVRAPWTAAVLDADPEGPRPWLATEYVEGPSLDEAVARTGPLPAAAVDLLAHQLAEAVAALHATGITHRDLKPSNVLLGPDGPRVIDFGIARAADSTRITRTGAAVGTPAFMSPEQALGDTTGPPSDVFSLAAVIVFAATGVGPFGRAGHPVVMLRRICSAEPDLDGVAEQLRTDLAPCLTKDPAGRPTAAELTGRLESRAAAGSPWRPPAVPGPSRRRGIRFALVGAGALAVVAGIVMANLPAAGPEMVAAAPTTAAPTTTATGAPLPSVITAGIVPSRIEGWVAAASTTRNAAYDVPPGWTPSGGDRIRGFSGPTRSSQLSGIAELGAPCGAQDVPDTPVWSGIAGAESADPAVAADLLARTWVEYFQSDDGPVPASTVGAPTPVTIADGVGASHVVTEVDVPAPDPCGAPRVVIHTVAAPGAGGGSVVWVLLADLDVPQTPSAADIDRIISTLRPAGLQSQCDPQGRAVGSWC